MKHQLATLGVVSFVLAFAAGACGGSKPTGFGGGTDPGGTTPNSADAGDQPGDPGDPFGEVDASVPVQTPDGDPRTCQEAAIAKSYVGCDYWPTVVPNLVKNLFDYAVVVSNVGLDVAKIEVTGPGGVQQSATVEPGKLATIYLPWVAALKGPATGGMAASAVVKAGAYHLVSDKPVIVYQFNALEYRGQGGPPGKSWDTCVTPTEQLLGLKCFSYSNDASLLLPSTAMTGNYRVFGQTGWTRTSPNAASDSTYFAVTATADDTDVAVKLSAAGHVLAGGADIPATNGGGTVNVKLAKGDVALVVSKKGRENDLSGSLVTASKPVQVISGVPCIDAPFNVQACDHIEETVFPAETLGKRYVMNVSTGPKGTPVGHLVRLYGNQDGTRLYYVPSRPASCPETLNAGQVADCGEVRESFEIVGDKEFGVASLMLGGGRLDPNNMTDPQGDPSMSFAVAIEQYRKTYLFLAPNDYQTSYVDIVGPPGVQVKLDEQPLTVAFEPVSGDFGVARVKLGPGNNGAHSVTADKPVGIQVMGYGANTSYQYPGGLNLAQIAPPPVR